MQKKNLLHQKRSEKGVALVITLAITAAILSAAVFINTKVRRDFEAAAVSKERGRMKAMTSSGINAAMALLVRDRKESNTDTIQEDWANPLVLDEISRMMPFEDGRVLLRISDEKGKIQVNALVKYPENGYFNETQKEFWIHFLDLALKSNPDAPEVSGPETIIEPLKDWLDSGDDDAITGTNGAEDSWYRSLERPYPCRNGRITCIDELFLVKNISRERMAESGILDLSEIFTAHCGIPGRNNEGLTFDGKININTASQAVIAALLPEGKEGLAAEIAAYRKDMLESSYVNDLNETNWYKKVPGCEDLVIKPELVTFSSDFFRIDSVAVMNSGGGLGESVIIQRVKNNEKQGAIECRVLSRWFTYGPPAWMLDLYRQKKDKSAQKKGFFSGSNRTETEQK
jgi:general secretion pathway protein K